VRVGAGQRWFCFALKCTRYSFFFLSFLFPSFLPPPLPAGNGSAIAIARKLARFVGAFFFFLFFFVVAAVGTTTHLDTHPTRLNLASLPPSFLPFRRPRLPVRVGTQIILFSLPFFFSSSLRVAAPILPRRTAGGKSEAMIPRSTMPFFSLLYGPPAK